MRRTFLGLAIGVAILLLIPASRASAQGLASIAAASVTSASTMEKQAGCWGCDEIGGIMVCMGGHNPGYFNCVGGFGITCRPSSPGCGTAAMLPLDPDGSAQYVSRGSRLGIAVDREPGGLTVRRNCEGVVVARMQTPDNITGVRIRTGSLSL